MKKKNNGFYHGAGTDAYGYGTERGGKDVADMVDGYASMGEEELLDELFVKAAEARRKGELDDKKLMNFYDSVKGMLTPGQLKKLDVLMRALMSDKSR